MSSDTGEGVRPGSEAAMLRDAASGAVAVASAGPAPETAPETAVEARPAVTYICGDCVSLPLADDSVDLVVGSPPYEDKRTYGIGFRAKGYDWIRWAMPRFAECLRVCRGPVCWVIMGSGRYDHVPIPSMLQTALYQAGYAVRPELVYRRIGIPGSGGNDWFRRDHEWVVCATRRPGKLPWADNTAMGHAPKAPPGGALSYRTADGQRINARTGDRLADGRLRGARKLERQADGEQRVKQYVPPARSNPGSVIDCGVVGGGHMGHPLAHANEAPYPLRLAEWMVRSLCPPGGVVLDPFAGSGTTGHAAVVHGRSAVLVDVRPSQIELARERMADVMASMQGGGA